MNQVSLRSILYGATIYDIYCTIYVQVGGILPLLMNGTVENSSSNTTHNWGETWPVSGFKTRGTDPVWNGERKIYIPKHEWSYQLGSPAIFHFNLASKTLTGRTHVWWFLRVMYVVVPSNFSMGIIPSPSTLSTFNFSEN